MYSAAAPSRKANGSSMTFFRKFLRLFFHGVLALAGGERLRCNGGDDLPDEPLLDVFFSSDTGAPQL